jgi:hypothetical protein
VSFTVITLCVASQRVFVVVVVVYFVIDTVRKILDTPSYMYFEVKQLNPFKYTIYNHSLTSEHILSSCWLFQ